MVAFTGCVHGPFAVCFVELQICIVAESEEILTDCSRNSGLTDVVLINCGESFCWNGEESSNESR